MNFQILKSLLVNNQIHDFRSSLGSTINLGDTEARELIQFAETKFEKQIHRTVTIQILACVNEVPTAGNFSPDEEFVYRGCAESPKVACLTGLPATSQVNPTLSLYNHKLQTGMSIYVSCTKSLAVAAEFAASINGRLEVPTWIYKIKSAGGIDCKKWFYPGLELHAAEEEVVFDRLIPREAIVGYSFMEKPNSFYSL